MRRTVLYINHNKNLEYKRSMVELIFAQATTIKPTWYPSQCLLKYPNFSVNVFHDDEIAHCGQMYDYIMESTKGNAPKNIITSNPTAKFIDDLLYSEEIGTISETIDDLLGIRSAPQLPAGFTLERNTCTHSWKAYSGFNVEAFEYCDKCDEKRELK